MIGGLYSSLNLTVLILLSAYTLRKYEQRIAKLAKDQNPDLFVRYSVREIKDKIREILTP